MTQSLLSVLRAGGRLVSIAYPPVDWGATEELARRRDVDAKLVVMSPKPEQLARIAELVATGEVRVEIAEVFPLEQVRRAHELSESGHTRGKIILSLHG